MSSSSMHVAKTGLTAQQTRMQVIANNLANVNTVGLRVIASILKVFSIRFQALQEILLQRELL